MSTNREGTATPASVGLYWLPLGAGDAARCVRWNGRVFEALVARHEHRDPCDLYHSALAVELDGQRFVIEMTPVWGNKEPERSVIGEGAVGLSPVRGSRFFRDEVRRWRNGVIPDVSEAVASPRRSARTRTGHSRCWTWFRGSHLPPGDATNFAPARCGTPTL